MKKIIFALFSICLIAISCKKDDPDPVAPTDKPYTNINEGTRWTYDVKTEDPVSGDTTAIVDTVTVTATDTTVAQGTSDERVYRILKHTGGANSYLNRTGSNYYQFQEIADLGVQIQALYLKDDQGQGATWEQEQSVTIPSFPFPVTIKLKSTITQKGIAYAVNGVTYNDVIQVDTDLSVPGATVNSTITNYYTRDIGLIEARYDIEIVGVTELHTQSLLKTVELH